MNCPSCGQNTLVVDEQLNRRRRFVDGRLERGRVSEVVSASVWCENGEDADPHVCSFDPDQLEGGPEFDSTENALRAVRKYRHE